jgi:AraC-like DNA-binding protein
MTEMKYTNPDCSLISLSLETKIPFHHLSYYFNTHLNYKFIDWRNKLRIEKNCKEMQNGKCNALKLESIALNSGFAAQSTFIRAFKVVTGVTPSDYIKQIEKERGESI